MKSVGFEVGAWFVQPSRCCITNGVQEIVLQARWMDVLVYLAKNADTIVGTEDIIENVWTGVEVSHDSVYATISHLRKELANDTTYPAYIETISSRGYRLIVPVNFPKPERKSAVRRSVIGISLVALVALAIVAYQTNSVEKKLPPNPNSIAVLPFADLSVLSDENFAVGFADSLMMELNSIDGIEVMARTSSFSLDARRATVQEIGHQLNVATVLEGSVRREGERLYVTAQLVKTEDGFHLWADTYNLEIGAMARIHQNISRQVAEGLGLFMPPAYLATIDPMDVPILLQSRVNTYTENNQERPTVIALLDGGYVIGWRSMDQDGSNWGVYGQKYDAEGGPEGVEIRFNSNTVESQYYLVMAQRPEGGHVSAWQSYGSDGSHWGVVGRLFDEAGLSISDEFQINDYSDDEQSQPAIAMLPDGRFVVVYKSRLQGDPGFNVFTRLFDQSGAPLSREIQVNTFEVDTQDDPEIAVLGDSGLIVTWTSFGQDGSSTGIYGRLLSDNGLPTGPEFRVNSYVSNDQDSSQITSLGNGGAVAVWQSRSQDNVGTWGVFGQRFDAAGAKLGSEFAVNSFSANDQYIPKVTATQDGGFFVCWVSERQLAAGADVFGQRFDSNGLPAGAELMINVVKNSYQRDPAPSSLADGSVIVAFYADDWDGSYFGVFRRRLVFSGLIGDSLEGKIGPDTFVIEEPFERIKIIDYAADIDRIDLSALNTDFESLTISMDQNNATIDTGQGVIDIGGVELLEAKHFLF